MEVESTYEMLKSKCITFWVLFQRQIGKERSRIGRTALHYIAENGNTDCLELLTSLGDFDLNATDHEGHTGLHLAVINGNRDSAQILINAKANINCLDHEKHSLVHWATGNNNQRLI